MRYHSRRGVLETDIETVPPPVVTATSNVLDYESTHADDRAREQRVERDFVWNAFVGLFFEGTWALGASFVIISVLIPTYLNELNSPKRLIGLMSAVGTLTVPLQLLAGHFLDGERRKIKLWIAYAGCG